MSGIYVYETLCDFYQVWPQTFLRGGVTFVLALEDIDFAIFTTLDWLAAGSMYTTECELRNKRSLLLVGKKDGVRITRYFISSVVL